MNNTYRSLLVVFLYGLAIAPTLANEYSVEYAVAVGYEANDNINLDTEDETSISGGRLAIPLTLGMRSERLEITLSNEFVSSRFDDANYDSGDNYLEGRAGYLFEKSKLEGYIAYAQESTRTSEFLDTGVVGTKATGVDTLGLGGKASHSFTETNGIIGGIDYSEVDYQSALYQDYRFTSGYLGLTHHWNKRTRLRLQTYGGRFEDEGDTEAVTSADSAGVQFGFDYEMSGRVDTAWLIGWLWVKNKYKTTQPDSPKDNRDNALMLTGSLSYSGERYRLTANMQSMPTPSGDGYLRYTQQIDVVYERNLTEYANLSVGFLAGQSEAVDYRINKNRDYASAQVELEYRLSPSWSVGARYEYSFQNQKYSGDRTSGHAGSNAMYVGLTYEPTMTVWSR